MTPPPHLTDLGLRVNVNEEFDDDAPVGTVISTDPEAGAEVQSGDFVLLIVSLGPPPVSVPDLTNMTQGQATNTLDDVGLGIRVSNTRQPVADPVRTVSWSTRSPARGPPPPRATRSRSPSVSTPHPRPPRPRPSPTDDDSAGP